MDTKNDQKQEKEDEKSKNSNLREEGIKTRWKKLWRQQETEEAKAASACYVMQCKTMTAHGILIWRRGTLWFAYCLLSTVSLAEASACPAPFIARTVYTPVSSTNVRRMMSEHEALSWTICGKVGLKS